MMRMCRTFHPVVQGAFYTEVFHGNGRKQYAMVYDCGKGIGKTAMIITLDDQIDRFVNFTLCQPRIDLLFISHFHADHISGLNH